MRRRREQDARFQQLMPDVVHWLGLSRIDRFVSTSDMKHDALVSQGVDIVQRVPIPDGQPVPGRPGRNRGEKAAGRLPDEPTTRDFVGRSLDKY